MRRIRFEETRQSLSPGCPHARSEQRSQGNQTCANPQGLKTDDRYLNSQTKRNQRERNCDPGGVESSASLCANRHIDQFSCG